MYRFRIANVSAVAGYLSITGKKTENNVTKDVTISIRDGETPDSSGKYDLYPNDPGTDPSATATFYSDSIDVVVNTGVFDDIARGGTMPLNISYKNSVFKTYDNTLTIYINGKEELANNIRDTSVISELFKYVLPTGYNVRYRKYIGTDINDNSITYSQSKEILKPSLVYPAARPLVSDYEAKYFDYYPVRSDGTVNTINQNKLFKCNGGSTKVLCCLSRKDETDNYSISILDYGTDSGNYHYLYSDSVSGYIVLSDICDLSNYRDDCQIVVEAQSNLTAPADTTHSGNGVTTEYTVTANPYSVTINGVGLEKSYTGDGTTASYNVSSEPTAVYVNGILQTPGTDYIYDVGQSTITFTTAPAAVSQIRIVYYTYEYNDETPTKTITFTPAPADGSQITISYQIGVLRVGSKEVTCDSDGKVSTTIGSVRDYRNATISIGSGVKLFNLFIHVLTVRISPYTTTLDHLVGAVGTSHVFPNEAQEDNSEQVDDSNS